MVGQSSACDAAAGLCAGVSTVDSVVLSESEIVEKILVEIAL